MGWINPAKCKDKWQALVNSVTNYRNAGEFFENSPNIQLRTKDSVPRKLSVSSLLISFSAVPVSLSQVNTHNIKFNAPSYKLTVTARFKLLASVLTGANKLLLNTGIPRYTRSHFTRFRYNAI